MDYVAKADYRRELVKQQSGRTIAAYVLANTGVHESTTDVVFGGHLLVAEDGVIVAEGERFRRDSQLLVTEVDTERLLVERMRLTSFSDTAHELRAAYRRVAVAAVPAPEPFQLTRSVDPHPFVPQDPRTLDERCLEIFSIQTAGLAKRLEHTGLRRAVLGLSGGLDSTLAFFVTLRTFELLGLPREGVLAVTLPGPGTSAQTLGNARALAAGAGVPLLEIDIRAACEQHIRDIGLDPEDRRARPTRISRRGSGRRSSWTSPTRRAGLVVGTGDLSELALGFCTYGGRPHGHVQRERRACPRRS